MLNANRFSLPIIAMIGFLGMGVPCLAQIQPTQNGTDTTTTTVDNLTQIQGGKFSSDGANQFHQFDQFNVLPSQTVDFSISPNVQNVISTVRGGSPSLINGQLQMTGGGANLYFLNPAGVIFGPSVNLNLPAALTVTTANQAYFGSDRLDVFGTANHSRLTGNPTAFQFDAAQPSAIVNHGNLKMANYQDLALFAGTVISPGSINAPGGQVTVATIPGKHTVRLRSPHTILNLEIQPTSAITLADQNSSIPTTDLAALITGGNLNNASQVTVTPEGVYLGSSPINPGDIVADRINTYNTTSGHILAVAQGSIFANDISTVAYGKAGNIDLSSQGNIKVERLLTRSEYSDSGNITAFSIGDGSYRKPNTSTVRNGNAGSINIESKNGSLDFKELKTTTQQGNGGNVQLKAEKSIRQSANSTPVVIQTATNIGNAGSVSIQSNAGDITLGPILTSSYQSGNAGNISISAPQGSIQTDILNVFATSGKAGNIDFIAGKNVFIQSKSLKQYLGGLCGTSGVSCDSGTDLITLDIDRVTKNPTIAQILKTNLGEISLQKTDVIITPTAPNSPLSPDGLPVQISTPSIVSGTDKGQAGTIRGRAGDAIVTDSIAAPAFQSQDGSQLYLDAGRRISLGAIDLRAWSGNDSGYLFLSAPSIQTGKIYGFSFQGISKSQGMLAIEQELLEIEKTRTQEYLGQGRSDVQRQFASIQNIQQDLTQAARQTSLNPALIYLNHNDDHDQWHWLIIPKHGEPIKVDLNATTGNIYELTKLLAERATSKLVDYQSPANALYHKIFKPIESKLEERKIDTLLLSMPVNLSSMPFAALMDDRGIFLAEKYYLSSIPSYNLSNIKYQSMQPLKILAMGVNKFSDDDSLKYPSKSVDQIMSIFPQATTPLKDKDITRQKFLSSLSEGFSIIHIETHAKFESNKPKLIDRTQIKTTDASAFIYFSKNQEFVSPDAFRNATIQAQQPIELLFLGACETAKGDNDYEFGFSGLAVQTGVKTAIASLWNLEDKVGSLVTSDFYQKFKSTPVKVIALRHAQQQILKNKNYRHPHFWAGLTMIGSPW